MKKYIASTWLWIKNFFNKIDKRILLIAIIGLGVLIIVLSTTVGFKLKASEIDAPNLYYEEGETININYEAIEGGASPILEVVSSSATSKNKKMSIDLVSTNIIIEDTITGSIWETLKVGEYANSATQTNQLSPIIVTYMYDEWITGKQLDAYTYSIAHREYKVEKISNGVRVVYTVGEHKPKLSWLPKRITGELYGDLYEIADEIEREALVKAYSIMTGTTNYNLANSLTDDNVMILYHLWYDIFGLTIETLIELNEMFGFNDNYIEMPMFSIPVEYTLDGGEFVAKIVSHKITEDSYSFEEGRELFITNIDLLPFFFSQNNQSDAFMFVPDGSGAIIEFDKPDRNYVRYSKAVYDSSSLISSVYETYVEEEKIHLPVFGITKQKQGVFGIIESGAMQSTINIRRANSQASANSIFPSMVARYRDLFSITGNVTIDMYSDFFNQTDYSVRYFLLDSNSNLTYMDMVKIYQEYLFDGFTKTNNELHLMLELVGAIVDRAHFAGIPYDKTISLTSYKEAEEIIKELLEYDNINYTYVGFSDGGVNANFPSKLKIENELGNKNKFNSLENFVKENNIKMFYDIPIAKVYGNGNGFNGNRNSVSLIGDYNRAFYPYDLASLKMNEDDNIGKYYLLSPKYLSSAVDRLLNKSKLDFSNISLRDLGSTYLADYGVNSVSPTLYENVIIENILKFSNEYQNVLLNSAYGYAIPFADYLANIPYRSSGHNMFSYDVPFMELVVNGYLPYSYESSNISNRMESKYMFLKALETGSGLRYTITKENSRIVKDSITFNYLYATEYNVLKSEIVEYSSQFNLIMQSIGNGIITNHVRRSDGVVIVTFENGKQLGINYSETPKNINGSNVESLDYLIWS